MRQYKVYLFARSFFILLKRGSLVLGLFLVLVLVASARAHDRGGILTSARRGGRMVNPVPKTLLKLEGAG
jgi:hypothetical protein